MQNWPDDMHLNFHQLLSESLGRHSAFDCFVTENGPSTAYAQVDEQSRRIAGWLRRAGVRAGDRVCVLAHKSPAVVTTYLAVLQIGAIFVPLNPNYTRDELRHITADSSPRLVIMDPDGLAATAQSGPPLGLMSPSLCSDVAVLIYTSGTTGKPKGAMLTHGALAANGLAMMSTWDFTRRDVLLHALPIFHAHGLLIALHCALLSGCTMIWLPRFDEDQAARLLRRSTVMMGVPTFYTRLLERGTLTRTDCQNVRLFISGSAPLLKPTFERFEEMTGHRIVERYGMSEALVIASNPVAGARLPGSVGFPIDGVDVRIASDEVIELKGPSVLTGYWGRPELNSAEFTSDGYFRTGDLGSLDSDGRLWISGRAKDLIISGGYNIYPAEVEAVLEQQAGIKEAAVIGVPHPDYGEAAVAVVCGAVDEARLLRAVRQQLAGYKTPKRAVFIEALPRNSMGKVQKAQLRDEFKELFSSD